MRDRTPLVAAILVVAFIAGIWLLLGPARAARRDIGGLSDVTDRQRAIMTEQLALIEQQVGLMRELLSQKDLPAQTSSTGDRVARLNEQTDRLIRIARLMLDELEEINDKTVDVPEG